MTNVERPLIYLDIRRSCSDKARRAGRIGEVCLWNQIEKSSDHRVSDSQPLAVTEDDGVQLDALTLAQSFVGGKKKCLVPAVIANREIGFAETRQHQRTAD